MPRVGRASEAQRQPECGGRVLGKRVCIRDQGLIANQPADIAGVWGHWNTLKQTGSMVLLVADEPSMENGLEGDRFGG